MTYKNAVGSQDLCLNKSVREGIQFIRVPYTV
jgi:hypothetical protein